MMDWMLIIMIRAGAKGGGANPRVPGPGLRGGPEGPGTRASGRPGLSRDPGFREARRVPGPGLQGGPEGPGTRASGDAKTGKSGLQP